MTFYWTLLRLEYGDCESLRLWVSETFRLWESGTKKLWDTEILIHWKPRTLRLWTLRLWTLRLWDAETLGHFLKSYFDQILLVTIFWVYGVKPNNFHTLVLQDSTLSKRVFPPSALSRPKKYRIIHGYWLGFTYTDVFSITTTSARPLNTTTTFRGIHWWCQSQTRKPPFMRKLARTHVGSPVATHSIYLFDFHTKERKKSYLSHCCILR